MTTQDTLALVKDMIASPHESAERATAMLTEHDDPRVRLIAQMWAQQRQVEQADDEAPPQGPTTRVVPVVTIDAVPSDPPPELRKLRRRLRTLVDELRLARFTAQQLGGALGACHCLGEDDACPDCRGRGAPGSALPNRALFARLVMPAVRRMKQAGSPPAHSESNSPHPPAGGNAPLERSDT